MASDGKRVRWTPLEFQHRRDKPAQSLTLHQRVQRLDHGYPSRSEVGGQLVQVSSHISPPCDTKTRNWIGILLLSDTNTRSSQGLLGVNVAQQEVAAGRRRESILAGGGHDHSVAGLRKRPGEPPEVGWNLKKALLVLKGSPTTWSNHTTRCETAKPTSVRTSVEPCGR